jgi:hypothetical protein
MNVYTQALDGAARAAADRVGSELFRIVQKPERAAALTRRSGSSGWTRTDAAQRESDDKGGTYAEKESACTAP